MACVQKAFGALTTRFWAAPITNPTGRSSSQNPLRKNSYFGDKLQVSLAAAGRPGNQAGPALADPVIDPQLLDLGAFESAGMAVIDVLERGRHFELSLLQACRQCAIGFPKPLALHQQPQTLLEVQIDNVGNAFLARWPSSRVNVGAPPTWRGKTARQRGSSLTVA